MAALGQIFKGIGFGLWLIFGVWGLVLDLAIVKATLGLWGAVVGFVIAPVTFAAAPWYALVAWGNWFPLLICYGGGIAGATVFGVGWALARD